MESLDVALLSAMWICFAIAFGLSVSVCAVFGCRRGLVKQLKVQVMVEPQWPGSEVDTNNGRGGDRARTNFGTNSHKVTSVMPQNIDSRDLDDGMNAFNTNDALKQQDNPTNPVAFSARSNGLHNVDLNSSRRLNANDFLETAENRRNTGTHSTEGTTPCEFKFSTPGGRSIGSKGASIFANVVLGKGDKENNNMCADSSPSTADGGRNNFGMVAQMATTNLPIIKEKRADGTLEMADLTHRTPSGTDSRRSKRR